MPRGPLEQPSRDGLNGAMTSTTSAAIDRLEDRYRVRFAGHPRVSRDPEELERIVADLSEIGTTAGPEDTERITNLREMYTKEIAAIEAAINVPFAVAATRLRMWADLTMSRYVRKFAGKDRRTRDAALLEELVTDLHATRTAMATIHGSAPEQRLDEAIALVDRALGIYRTEAEAIRTTRRTGSFAEQGTRFAQLANAQFEAYGRYFAKQSRLSRHPPALERIIRALDEIRNVMQSLKLAGFADPNNDKNIVIVDDRLKAYRAELAAIRALHAETAIEQRIGALGVAANEVFAAYRDRFAGKPRETSDPDELDELFERLWLVARQMDALDTDHDDDTNARNLRLVTDNLLLYGRQYDAIKKARG